METNEELVQDLLTHSPYGVLGQAFIMELTKAERLEIYQLAYEWHLEDKKVKRTEEGYSKLTGMCSHLVTAIHNITGIWVTIWEENNGFLGIYLPEFGAMRPQNKSWGSYWWKTNPRLNTRTRKYESLIEQVS